MRTSDFDYVLPPSLIAQAPAAVRDRSRLMIVHRSSQRIEHGAFSDLATLIPSGDAIALNTTRVMKARLLGQRESGAPAEVFLLRPGADGRFEAMVRPGGKLHAGRRIHLGPGASVVIDDVTERRTRWVRFEGVSAAEAMERFGHVPLPPYIERGDSAEDAERYQTVYASALGSVAAPTAGLHFTPALLSTLEGRGVRRADLLLHVGAGTFKPVEVDDPAQHVMHSEFFRLTESAARTLAETRAAGGAVWGVGTTTVRTLEAIARRHGTVMACEGETDIFIRPPYTFGVVDRLITNFHLPRSTLLMLVAAFAGYDLTMHAYRVAVEQRYRFYSYGDAMAIL